jgi:hypothetical protein
MEPGSYELRERRRLEGEIAPIADLIRGAEIEDVVFDNDDRSRIILSFRGNVPDVVVEADAEEMAAGPFLSLEPLDE